MIISGIGASPGIAEGIVKVVEGIKDIGKFNDGDILVAEITEPSMVIMMNKAGAIVTDKGGMTSHPAIISRELGIPCVVATKKLKDGMDWRPTEEMVKVVEGKDFPDRYELEEFPTYEDYCSSPEFEVYWLKELYKD